MEDQLPPKNEFAEGMIDLSKIPIQEAEDGVFEAYSNVVNADWTLTDIRLRFAQLMQVSSPEKPTWEAQTGILFERAAITIPWWQAKLLAGLLSSIVTSYEQANGELKQPKLAPRPNG